MANQLIDLYRQAEMVFFKGISIKHLDLGNGSNAYMTGVPVADLNLVYITQNTKTLQQALNQAKQFYDQDHLPFVVIIPHDFCTPETDGLLNTMGHLNNEKSIAMHADVSQFSWNKLSDEVAIRSHRDGRLQDWMRPLIGAFESSFEISSQYAATHERALKNHTKLHHFTLYKDEKALASITLSLHDTIARIDDLGTLPEFQGKGYATALMRHALLEAKKFGADHCFLESSDQGFSIYQKLGFKPLFENNIYSPER